MAPKVLFVLTSYGKDDEGLGWYLPEFAHPYYKLASHAEIVVASPEGGKTIVNPDSIVAWKDVESQRFLKEKTELWEKTEVLETFKGRASEFEAIFYVGGAGPMFDLADSLVSQEIIKEFWEAGKVVSAVCHGVVALTHVTLTDGTFMVAGKEVTGFSNEEEEQTGLIGVLPYLLETEIKKSLGSPGLFRKAEKPWGSKLVVSGQGGRLITGQNQASAVLVGDAIWHALSK